MQRKDRRFFERILLVQSPSQNTKPMADLLVEIAKEEGYTCFVDRGNVYMEKRTTDDIPVGLVAHTDTVHKRAKDFAVVGNEDWLTGWDNTTGRQHGIGGDDRCGIFMALMVARRVPNAKLFFPRDEEIGCVGSSLMKQGWLDDCAFIMQADRRGWGDVTKSINYLPVMSSRFQKALKKIMDVYAMRFVDGMTTDIEAIKEGGAKVCAFNMSASYYYPHQECESIYLPGVLAGIEFMVEVAKTLGHRQWKHTSPEQARWNEWERGGSWAMKDCLNCGKPTPDAHQLCWLCSKDLTVEQKVAWSDALSKVDAADAVKPCATCGTFGETYHVGNGIHCCADCVTDWYEKDAQEPDCMWGPCDGCGATETVYPAGDNGQLCVSCVRIVESMGKPERLVEEVQ